MTYTKRDEANCIEIRPAMLAANQSMPDSAREQVEGLAHVEQGAERHYHVPDAILVNWTIEYFDLSGRRVYQADGSSFVWRTQ